MFGKKKLDRSFSYMLAEEILRAELTGLYGNVRLFQCNSTSERISERLDLATTVTDREKKILGSLSPRAEIRALTVKFSALIGAFERLYPGNPSEDRRRKLRHVQAECRVFSLPGGAIAWHPHYCSLIITNDEGRMVEGLRHFYEEGTFRTHWFPQNGESPCRDMCESQTETHYPKLYRELHKDRSIHSFFD